MNVVLTNKSLITGFYFIAKAVGNRADQAITELTGFAVTRNPLRQLYGASPVLWFDIAPSTQMNSERNALVNSNSILVRVPAKTSM